MRPISRARGSFLSTTSARDGIQTDENLPVEAAALLRAAGFDATTVLDQKLGGHPDSAIASTCRLEGRTLVTLDLDFSNIDAYPPGDYAGLVVLRLSCQDKDSILQVLQTLVPRLVGATLAGRLWIVEETRVRERV